MGKENFTDVRRGVVKIVQQNYHQTVEREIPEEMKLSGTDLKFLSDSTYAFLKVRRGRGFDLARETTKLATALRDLNLKYAFLFFQGENGLWYYSRFALQLGEIVRAYSNSNIPYCEFTINNVKVLAMD